MAPRVALEPLPRRAISVAQACEILGDDASTVRRLIEAGHLEGYRGGSGTVRPRWRVYVDSIEAYRQRRAQPVNENAEPPRRQPVRVVESAADREAEAWLKNWGVL